MSIDWSEKERPDGWTVRAELHPDTRVTPDDYDCYTPSQKAAWRADDWGFVVVVVTVSREGVELGSAALGGCEYGHLPLTAEDDTVTGEIFANPLHDGTVDELANEAADAGLATLAKLCTSAADGG
jgi:hypothetical protein